MITTYSYDRSNRLTGLNAGGTLTTLTVDGAGNRTLEQSPGETTSFSWDAVGRMYLLGSGTNGRYYDPSVGEFIQV
jgi:YD repeat-containing protein